MENEKITTGDKVMGVIGIAVIIALIVVIVKMGLYSYNRYISSNEISRQENALQSARGTATDSVHEDEKKNRLLKEYELVEEKLDVNRDSIYIDNEADYKTTGDDYSAKVLANGKEYMVVFSSVGITKTYNLSAKYNHQEFGYTHYEITGIKKLVLIK
ncbi:hypothetical protein EJM73_07060 [Clostridium botulinum]|uniref:Uncharacterized protein n=2 Tax=Clostridium botulinum TaxID=1491 RepID=A0A077K0Y1_CLOBO|nr:hypothetical protein [Clostridium botulinum]KEI83988.1 hypothetical protein N493_18940 [Clostridium botulinum B2 433]NCI20718.1 hypothetical protein [Clostridium botulinum]NCI35426.1 hypothetical protein [Clostridium botulinum]NCI74542.1 hypothetical protein [Clostridium botulinum]NDI38389.1 hypothetical protein [Clostridium botulinum]